jgi:hypothetical protein
MHSSDHTDAQSDLSDLPLGTDTSIELSLLGLPDLAPRRILHSDSDSTDSFYNPHNPSDGSLSDDSLGTHDVTSEPAEATHIIHQRPPSSPTTLYSLFQQAQPTTTTLLPEQAQFFGDTIQLPKPDTIFRVATKNINHLSVNKIDDQITLMCVDQQRLEIDIQGIIEYKVDTGKYHVRQAFHAATRQVFDHAIVELGSSAYTSFTDYKPGGTAIIAQGNVIGRIHLHDSYKYGHWSYVSTQGSQGIHTIFITAYQVCKILQRTKFVRNLPRKREPQLTINKKLPILPKKGPTTVPAITFDGT